MKDLKCLADLLDKLLVIQQKLLDLENIKTGVLLKGDADELDAIVKLEQPLIMSCENIEKQRDCLQEKMGLKGVALKQIISDHQGFEGNRLQIQYDLLSEITDEIKTINNTNKQILNSQLNIVNHILHASGITQDEVITYKKR